MQIIVSGGFAMENIKFEMGSFGNFLFFREAVLHELHELTQICGARRGGLKF